MLTSFPYTALRGFCRRIYGDIPLLITPTAYLIDYVGVQASQQVNLSTPINANSDFVLIGLAYVASEDESGLFMLTDSSTSISLFSQPIPLNIVADFQGMNVFGASLAYPYWIGRNSAFLSQLQKSAGGASNVRISLIGFHIRELV